MNEAYWDQKLERNMQRDQETLCRLVEAGWDSLVVWECELHDLVSLRRKIVAYLGS